MQNRFQLFSLALLIAVLSFFAKLAAQSEKNVDDLLHYIDKVQLKGYIGSKFDLAYQNRILAQDVTVLTDVFKTKNETWCWQSEFWGKWFTSAVLAYRYKPTQHLKSLLDKSVQSLINKQAADGYIGNYSDEKRLEQWDIWGMKYCMLGLLAYYDLTNDKISLLAASRLADYLIKELASKNAAIVKKGNHRGMAASSILEPIVLLYSRTKNQKYLDFAKEIVKQWESKDGPQLISKAMVNVSSRFPKPKDWFGWGQGQKAYEMMSCYEGLLELYRITGNNKYKKAVENTWKNIMDNEINIAGSGSSVECWFGGKDLQAMPISHYQETCVTATWIKLSQQLLRLSNETIYADAIEQTFYNALLGSMKEDGSNWSKYTPLNGKRSVGEEQCGMGINCCIASGPRGLFAIPFTTVMQKQTGFNVNLFIEGTYQLKSPRGQALNVSIRTDYPASGTILIQPGISKPEELEISLRVPAWSSKTFLAINGDTIPNISAGKFISIKRTWKATDMIEVRLDMRGRIFRLGKLPEYIAIMSGPIVLARDTRLGGEHVDESITPVTDRQGYFPLEPVIINENQIWMQYKGDFMLESSKARINKNQSLPLCDYASAGKTYSDSSWFRVWFPQKVNEEK